MRPSELIFLGLLAVYAGVSLWFATDMPYASAQTFGPGFLPLNMAAAMLVLIAIIAVRGRLRRTAPEGEHADGASARRGVAIVAMTLGLLVVAVAASRFGSLLLPLGLALVVVTAVGIGRGWVVGVVSTVLLMAAVYAIFDLWLGIPVR